MAKKILVDAPRWPQGYNPPDLRRYKMVKETPVDTGLPFLYADKVICEFPDIEMKQFRTSTHFMYLGRSFTVHKVGDYWFVEVLNKSMKPTECPVLLVGEPRTKCIDAVDDLIKYLKSLKEAK